MSEDIPRDRRVAAAVETEGLVVVPGDRAVVVPEAAPLRAATRPLPRDGSPGSNMALWVLGALVASGVALAIIIWALAPNGEVRQTGFATPVSDTVEPGSNVARGLALAAPEAIRTKTVNLRGDEDLLNLATGVGAVDSLGGAPVTADGVEVTELLGDRAFEVGDPAGNTMVVYLPYGVPGDVFVTLGQKVTFVGSLSPTSEDLTTIAGATAATAAAGEGAYIVAVPESVHVVPPSAADAA